MARPVPHLFAAAAFVLSVTAAPLAHAQAPAPPPAGPAELIQPTDEQLTAFVAAYLEVATIQNAVNQQVQGAPNDQEVQRLQQQGEAQILAVIQAADLTVDEYIAILDRAAADEPFAAMLQERISTEVEALQGAPAAPASAP